MKISEEQIELEAKSYAEFVESASLDTLQDFKSGAMWMQIKLKELYKWKDPLKELPEKEDLKTSYVVLVKAYDFGSPVTAYYNFAMKQWELYTTCEVIQVFKWQQIQLS